VIWDESLEHYTKGPLDVGEVGSKKKTKEEEEGGLG